MADQDRMADRPRQTPQQRTDEPGEGVEDVPATTPQARTEQPQEEEAERAERGGDEEGGAPSPERADPGRLEE